MSLENKCQPSNDTAFKTILEGEYDNYKRLLCKSKSNELNVGEVNKLKSYFYKITQAYPIKLIGKPENRYESLTAIPPERFKIFIDTLNAFLLRYQCELDKH